MPNDLAMFRQRSPQRPQVQRIALPPGGTQLDTAASMPPVPEAVMARTVLRVWKTYFRSSSTSARMARNSAERWKKTGLANSSSVSSGTGVGPGVSKRGFIVVGSSFGAKVMAGQGYSKDWRPSGLRTPDGANHFAGGLSVKRGCARTARTVVTQGSNEQAFT